MRQIRAPRGAIVARGAVVALEVFRVDVLLVIGDERPVAVGALDRLVFVRGLEPQELHAAVRAEEPNQGVRPRRRMARPSSRTPR